MFAIKQHAKNKTMDTKEIKEFRNIWSNPKRFDTKNKTMETKKITFTETLKELEIWIDNVQFDLEQDWNEEKEEMQLQLQQLLIAKANLEQVMKHGKQIFSSSITLR